MESRARKREPANAQAPKSNTMTNDVHRANPMGAAGSAGQSQRGPSSSRQAANTYEQGGERVEEGAEDEGGRREDANPKAPKEQRRTQRTNTRRGRIQIVSVNVNTLKLTSRKEGAAAHGGMREMRKQPNANLESLIQWMQVREEDGTKTTALFVLSSTQLTEEDIQPVMQIIRTHAGYACKETHGVPGRKKRREIAGVMMCWDVDQLYTRPVAKRKMEGGETREVQKQVVAQGRT